MRNEGHAMEWISRAYSDRDSALFLYENMYPKPLEVICYLCQQASEKALKSLLFVSELPLEKSHDLTRIVERLTASFPVDDKLLRACAFLTPYATSSRYPTRIEIDEPRAKKVIEEMRYTISWVDKCIEEIRAKESQVNSGD